jgi:hypothetical protein
MPHQSFADVIADWEKLLAAVDANKDDLPYVATYRQQLETEITGAKAANVRQAAAQAEAQQATRDVEGFLTRSHTLADQIRFGIKTKYGRKSEKLKEFGLKVFRGVAKKKTTNAKPRTQTPAPQGTSPPVEEKAAPQVATSEAHNLS